MCRAVACAMLGMLLVPLSAAQRQDVPSLIEHAKQADVSVMDKRLPAQPFAEWLTQTVGDTATIAWEVNDCGEGTGSSADTGRDLPLCVGAVATLADGRTAYLYMAVGSAARGVTPEPSGFYVLAVRQDGKVTRFRTLSEIAAVIQAQ